MMLTKNVGSSKGPALHLFFANNSLTIEEACIFSRSVEKEDCALIIVNKRIKGKPEDWKGKVINPPHKTFNNKLLDFYSDTKRSKEAYNEIIKTIENHNASGEVNIYLPNIHHTLTNATHFYLPRVFPQKTINYHILVEGSLNFTNHKIRASYTPVMIAKKTISRIHGIPYKVFFGSFCGDDLDSFSSILSPTELGLSHSSLPVRKIEFNKTWGTQEENEDILILGQYLSSQLGEKKNKQLIELFISWIESEFKEFKIHYKGHPLHPDPVLEGKLSDLGCIQLPHHIPLERLIVEKKFSQIISISSSGLMMAKIILGDEVTCQAYGLEFLDKNTPVSYYKIKEVYKKVGIQCVEIKGAD